MDDDLDFGNLSGRSASLKKKACSSCHADVQLHRTDLSNALLKDLYSSDYVTDLVSGDIDTPEADEDLTVETDEDEDVDDFLASIGVEVPADVVGGAGGGAGGRK